jgi:hypothetical protein
MAADEQECVGIQDVNVSGTPAWQISFMRSDGGMRHHIMPTYIVEARAIELEMDPEQDFDEVLDIILHEPFVDDDDPDDPAAAEGYVTTDASGRQVAGNLFTAETIKDAREAHQLRVAKAKSSKANISVPASIKQQIRQRAMAVHRQGPDEVRDLRQTVRDNRMAIRGRGDGNPLKG